MHKWEYIGGHIQKVNSGARLSVCYFWLWSLSQTDMECDGREALIWQIETKGCTFTQKSKLCSFPCSWNNWLALAAALPWTTKFLEAWNTFSLPKKYDYFVYIKNSKVMSCSPSVKLAIRQLLSCLTHFSKEMTKFWVGMWKKVAGEKK